MVVELKPKKKQKPLQAPTQYFTIQNIEYLFSQNKNWKKFYKENENRLWESRIDVYSWPVYPLHTRDDEGMYRCVLHPSIEVPIGPDKPPMTMFFKNIYYAEFISHCIFYKPEEHKKYILEKLFPNHVSSTGTTATATTTNSPTNPG